MRVPREIDELMWAVAEQRNPETNEQFLERYPEFSAELERRVQMVSTLRGSRPRKEPELFVPRESVRSFGPSRLAVAGVAALVLASVTFATFATLKYVNSKRSTGPIVESQPEIIFNPPDFPAPFSTTSGTGFEPREENVPQVTGEQPIRETEKFDPYKGLVTIESEEITLSAAIQEIAGKAGLRAIIAPGFEEKRIKIRFINQPAIDVIERLGASFGFTTFKQNKVELLIIPASGTGTSPGPMTPGSFGISPSLGDEKDKGVRDTGTGGF